MRITSYRVEINSERLNILVKEKATNYDGTRLNSPDLIVRMFINLFQLDKLAEESVYILAMDVKSHPVAVFLLSKGTVCASIVSPREIFIRLLLCGATNFVLVHNHPSGDPTPSNEDLFATKRVKEVGELINIKIIDHIVIGYDTYWSLREHDQL